MEKRTVVITGGNTGLGYKCAQHIAMNSKNYTVVIACRNLEKAATAKKNLQQETGNPHIYALELDLASLESIRNFYDIFCHEKYPPLHALVCNAGVHGHSFGYTKDGFEETFGVNHLGHYLLANLMLNQMMTKGRIVFVASDMHDPPRFFPFPTPTFKNARLLAYPDENDNIPRYPTSKLCNILCTYEMATRLAAESDKHITVNAFNPGFMPDTSLSAALSPVLRIFLPRLISIFAGLLGRGSNVEKSGKALAAMITDRRYEHTTGTYNDRGKVIKSSGPSYDKTAAKNLWVESAELVQLKQGESILSIT
jgi:NAD(P)-dependent dehydrogenase (short-subunit alcohol dehydrogenase family)